jgi:hypothetical protein
VIKREAEGLRRTLDKLGDAESFAAIWATLAPDADTDTDDAETQDTLAAAERHCQEIVEAAQEAFDYTEAEAVDRQLVPRHDKDMPGKEWWDAAISMRIVAEVHGAGENPGRWRRLALYGHLDHAQVPTWNELARLRQLFSHDYGDADFQEGREVHAIMERILTSLPEIIRGLVDWRDMVWPPEET